MVTLEQFELLAGEPSTYRSSAPVRRAFCVRCGTQLTYRHDDSPQRIELTTATLDEPSLFPPSREIWYSQKVQWAADDRELPHYLHESPRGSDSS